MHNPEKIVIYNCLFYVLERYFCSYMFFYSRQKEKKEQIKQSDSVLFRFLIIFIVPFVETR